ncbi:hypothetical protein FISHEDRAFT_74665 [Fistulina hepatica ATCC 64428]|uniref:DNA-directed RNA polymerase III subunit n=1 Tax=Fistulina hepatica ATCC 64428 TaxID=1128425 RepID=A0A0D7A8Q0_9AGAR|nr:hypothetical protein FISHEDRAFT_74665 [Fistulina hepatica ATCC 64428]
MAGRGGRGRGRGRGFGGASNLPPMGLTFADIQSMSREGTALYPPMRPPVLEDITEDERRIAQTQIGFATRLRSSQYYLTEITKSDNLEKYSDRFLNTAKERPTLKRKGLNPEFFPSDIFETFFNPKKKAKHVKKKKQNINLDDVPDEGDDEEKSGEEKSDEGSQVPSDYDVEEEYDNDYADNYFDNGEGDDNDDLGDGDGGGGGDHD